MESYLLTLLHSDRQSFRSN